MRVNDHAPLPGSINLALAPWPLPAREAIDTRLKEQARKARRSAIVDAAAEMAGAKGDLDRELESAGIERLTRTGREPGRVKK